MLSAVGFLAAECLPALNVEVWAASEAPEPTARRADNTVELSVGLLALRSCWDRWSRAFLAGCFTSDLAVGCVSFATL